MSFSLKLCEVAFEYGCLSLLHNIQIMITILGDFEVIKTECLRLLINVVEGLLLKNSLILIIILILYEIGS